MFNIEEELKKLPVQPGVYIMRDKDDTNILEKIIKQLELKKWFL